MRLRFGHEAEAARHESAIRALTHRTGVPLGEVRALFGIEFARLARGATVRSYLITRAASNVLADLRRKRRRSMDAAENAGLDEAAALLAADAIGTTSH